MKWNSGGKKTKTGAYGTGATYRRVARPRPAAPMLDWRQFFKLRSAYTDALVADQPGTNAFTRPMHRQSLHWRLSSTD